MFKFYSIFWLIQNYFTLYGDLFGGGSDAPDYTPVAEASKEAAEVSAALGREQLAESKRQYDLNYAVAQPVIEAQLETMNQSNAQAKDYYDYSLNGRAVEQQLNYEAMGYTPEEIDQIEQTPEGDERDALTAQLASTASARQAATDQAERDKITGLNADLSTRIGESNTDVYNRNKADIDAETGQAVADARSGFTNAQNTTIRQGLRYGLSADKLAEASNRNATTAATIQAAAANGTRTNAVNTMYNRGVGEAGQTLTGATTDRSNKIQDESLATAKKLDVAGLYRNLPSASQGAYSTATTAGNSAVANQNSTSNQYLTTNQNAAGTILSGTQQQLSGLTGILNSQTSVANTSANSGSSALGALGSVAGSAIGIYSDENLKKDIKPSSDKDALDGIENLEIKKWKYDENKVSGQDSKQHIGAMAQDMKKNLGNEVSDGHVVDIVSALGINMAAIKALSKKVDSMKGSKHG